MSTATDAKTTPVAAPGTGAVAGPGEFTQCACQRKHMRPLEAKDVTEEELERLRVVGEHFGPRWETIPRRMRIRFIRGYWTEKEPVKATIEKLEETLAFRTENKVDTLLREFPMEKVLKFKQQWPHGIHGIDKFGRPVYIERPGIADVTKIAKELKREDLKLAHLKQMEANVAFKNRVSEREGYDVYKNIVIMDLEGFSRKHMGSDFVSLLREIMNIDQYYYPEVLAKLYVINAPWLFKMLWKTLSPLMHPITRSRIEVLGSDYLVKIQEFIDIDQLPQFLGGQCKCPKEGCLRDADFFEHNGPAWAVGLGTDRWFQSEVEVHADHDADEEVAGR